MKIIGTVILLLLPVLTYSQTNSTDKGNIYFLRATGFTGSARQFKIFVDGNLACKIGNDQYLILEVSSGQHSFAVQMDGQKLREDTERIEVMIEAGKNYYLTSVLNVGAMWSAPQVEELTENSGKLKLTKLVKITCGD